MMEVARQRVGGFPLADPTESLEIAFQKAHYLIGVHREPGGAFIVHAQYPRPNTALNVMAIVFTEPDGKQHLAGEIGIGRVRPYRAARELRIVRSKSPRLLPIHAWEAVAPRLVECLRDVAAVRVETRYQIKELFRKRQLVLRLNDNGERSPVLRAEDDKEAASAAVPWRGVRVSVDAADEALVGIFNTLDVVRHPQRSERLFAFASVLQLLMQRYLGWSNGEVPEPIRAFLARPGQAYFFRPAALLDLFAVETRKPRYEVTHQESVRMRRRRLKSGGWSSYQSTRTKKRIRRYYGPLLNDPDAVLDLFVRAGCITPEIADETRRFIADRQNPFAPFARCDFGQFARDIQVRYSNWPPGSRMNSGSARLRRWHKPQYLLYEVRLAPVSHDSVLAIRAAEQNLFADLDAIIETGGRE